MSPRASAAAAPARRLALLDLGFRPFFLCACAAAPALVAAWTASYLGHLPLASPLAPVDWHAHEMIFGYAGAVLAGFLLTAASSWSGRVAARGAGLAALVALWLAGRAAAIAPVAPPAIAAAIDVAFLPAVAIVVARVLVRGPGRGNLVLCALLVVLGALDACLHLDALGVAPGAARTAAPLAVYVVALAIAVIGGRVIPSFTRNAVPGAEPAVRRPIEILSIASLAALAAAVVADRPAAALALGAVAALAHAVRLAGWWSPGVARRPMLWILFAGYAWLVTGFALAGLSGAGLVPGALSLHAITVGGIGVVTLGMMVRVSLGHTGRAIEATRAVTAAFVLVNAAAAARVLVPLAAPSWYVGAVALAAALWVAAFLIVLVFLAPKLVAPRADA